MQFFGNFKMNEVTDEYIDKLCENTYEKNVGLALPACYIDRYAKRLKDAGILVGAENLHEKASGAYTGELSGSMLKNVGCDFVLIGHSERRKYYGETNEIVHQKVLAALSSKLKPVICVGESERDYLDGKTLKVVKNQVLKAVKDLYSNEIKGIIIAYEPVWAIGTGRVPKNSEVEAVVSCIKETINKHFDGENVQVLYGGSCNDKNAKELKQIKDLDGFLIGGACMDVAKFNTIIKA